MWRRVTLATVATFAPVAFLAPQAHATAAAPQSGDTTIIGHRGAPEHAPENTLSSVRKAAALHVTWVENDVQRTKDGRLVVIHDDDLKRTTNVESVYPDRSSYQVGDYTLREIKKLDAGSWFDKKYQGERIPTLRQYLHLLDRTHQKLLLEVKSPELYPGVEKNIVNELRSDGWLDRQHVRNKLIVQSFSADSMKTFHTLRPDVRTGFLGTPKKKELPKYATFVDAINPTYKDVTADYVSAVHRLKGAHGRKMEMYTWTVNDAKSARSMVKAGVDGLISSAPALVRQAVQEK